MPMYRGRPASRQSRIVQHLHGLAALESSLRIRPGPSVDAAAVRRAVRRQRGSARRL